MKNVLYIGNNLKSKKSNISSIQTLGPLLESEGYTVFYASSKNNKILRLLDMLSRVLKLKNTIDVVLIDTYSTHNFYYALLVSQLCRVLKIAYIPILHGGNLPSRLKRNPKLSGLIFNYAKHNVAPSLYLKNEFEAFGFHDIIYVPNAIKIEAYPFNCNTIEYPKLLWVRSFSEIYNPTLAISILSELKKTEPEAKLCMVGPDADGSLAAIKQRVFDLNLNVEFTGKLTKQEWISRSKDFNIFINTTNVDNTPMSVIEAMALGMPVVSTNVGGLPFLISDKTDGLLVLPNDVEAFVNAILKIKTDTALRAQLVLNARQKVESFSWKTIKPQWDAVLS
ncbi:glycosyltransferase family 4 protein [Winogradskyella eckloniae]|uniref:glycosyltransferase family 4 protein n=1 Tax=Winogradskyella eckloniae TaxID=1089306 RepID=UPI0015679D98|nr:glycosyltransferase family 4 protein [Winogradskyella eckloniae]NRD20539.1 glycosyltransferase family 4 protein [Winogradskyella eckloniae]